MLVVVSPHLTFPVRLGLYIDRCNGKTSVVQNLATTHPPRGGERKEPKVKDRRTGEASGAEPTACKFKKVRQPNLRLGEKEVEALIQSLEARGASHRSPEETESRPPATADAAPPREVGLGERMSEEDFEDVALVLKMTRSASNARQCGLRILAEARRAREEEERLTKALAQVSRRTFEKEAG